MNQSYIEINQLEVLDNLIDWKIGKGELNAVIGPNKSGKTHFAKIICGHHFRLAGFINKSIENNDITFSDFTADSSRFQYAQFYYQQRYNFSDAATIGSIQEFLGFDVSDLYQNTIFSLVLNPSILSKKLIELSSGETRKVLILKNLFQPSKIHVLDNPFIGLDANSIEVLSSVFSLITKKYKKTVLLLLNSKPQNLDFDAIIYLKKPSDQLILNPVYEENSLYKTPETSFKTVFTIQKQELKISSNTLIHDLSWTINTGEKWALKGANGSGKSTLMSLLNADNPVAYSLGISLFDKERGSGESIWDIKSKIGFISPELQLFWDGGMSVRDTVRSGFSNTQVLNRKLNPQEEGDYQKWIHLFCLQTIENKLFATLSSGEKRMVMIVRALITNPPFLILDEPFQGLDEVRFSFVYHFLANFVDKNRTLVQIAHSDREWLPCVSKLARIEEKRLLFSEF